MSSKETQELLYDVLATLRYNPETGALTRSSGKPAFTAVNKNSASGYYVGKVGGVQLYAHRVALAVYTGAWPEGEVDHINGDGLDNRLANLRVVDRATNRRNGRLHKNSRTGVSGICWAKLTGKWQAQIKVNRKMLYLGQYDCFFRAVLIRKAAERLFDFHENHGQKRVKSCP